MRFSGKQKKAIEKITGRYWNYWDQDALEAYFNFTDRGIYKIPIEQFAMEDFEELMERHHWHTVTVEEWKEDFKKGLLFLDDFLNQDYPEPYIKHAFEIYKSSIGGIPSKYIEVCSRLNIERF